VSAIPIHETLEIMSPFIDAVINKATWQCAPLQRDSLLQLINGVELPAVVDLLLQLNSTQHRITDAGV